MKIKYTELGKERIVDLSWLIENDIGYHNGMGKVELLEAKIEKLTELNWKIIEILHGFEIVPDTGIIAMLDDFVTFESKIEIIEE